MGVEGRHLTPVPDPEPVAGELVDNDHDGEPDVFEHGAELEKRRDTTPVEADTEVVDAVLVDEAGERQLAWRRTMEARPVVPNWLAEREQRIEAVRWATRYTWHRAKFHGVRIPLYGLRLTGRAVPGAARCLTWWGRWVSDQETNELRQIARKQNDIQTVEQLRASRAARIKHRLLGSVAAASVAAGGLTAMDILWPSGWWLLTPTAIAALGILGGRKDKPLVAPATLTQQATKLTPDVVERAFIAAGLADEKHPIAWVPGQPIQKDGKGWLAILDLPYGKSFRKHVAKKRADIASGLDVNQVTVFLDPDPISERRVRLWVSDVDVFAQKPVPSPLLTMEKFDFWQAIPFGLDARDRLVTLPLLWTSLLVGAIPRMGKTFAARISAAAAALDPWVRMYVYNGKGDGAWEPFTQVAHRYGRGIRDEVVERLVADLTELVADMNARNDRIAELPPELRPEDKLTPGLARNRRLNMPLTGIWIDEVQRYLEHPEHGAKIVDLLTDLVKVGPSVGIMVILATQKPDGQVIPDKLRGQIGTRFAMKVMTWQASETILGAGTYSAGMDASTLLRSHKGVGMLLGADDGELAERGGQTVRTHLLNGPGVDKICRRGRALREAEGTLTGMAAGDMPAESRPSRVLDDLAKCFDGDDKVHSEVAVARLSELDPGTYDGWTTNQLAAALAPFGVKPGQTWAVGLDGKKTNRQGYALDVIRAAQAAVLDQKR